MSWLNNASILQRLGALALLLGALALVSGSPYAANHARIDVEQLARAVEQEKDHLEPIELAEWIKNRRPGLRLIDLRSAKDFDEYHLPTAERVPIDSITHAAFKHSDVLVLYSEGGAHAAQAWVFLRALGHEQVFVLHNGLNGWLDEVMNVSVAENADAGAKAAFDRAAELSKYFGGVPTIGPAVPSGGLVPVQAAETVSVRTAGTSANSAIRKLKRRSC